jgi:glyoxylase-like metal-dependent hydrolase (beta-lactamase superfamily II)
MKPADIAYARGLHEVGDGLWAWLQPDGGWGWSNAGLVTGSDTSLLVDTLFDLRLTAEMLDAMSPHLAGNPISTVVNTHANGDHCYGNAALPDAEVVASTATAEEMGEVPPALLSALAGLESGDEQLDAYVRKAFGPFHFDGIELRLPTRTFDDRLTLDVGGAPVELIEVGPAHTQGDVIAHAPTAGVVFTGDILFVHGTPIVWAGPIANWIRACDQIVALAPTLVVPGHGPVTDADGVRAVRDYLAFIEREARARFEGGMEARDAARDIELGPFGDWGEPERIVVNVESVYRELDPSRPSPSALDLFTAMAHWR